jgi:hypothetical protein
MTTKLYNFAQLVRLNAQPATVANTDSSQKIVKVFQGQECQLRFSVYNGANRTLNIADTTFVFKMWDPIDNRLLVTKSVAVIDPELATVDFDSNELLDYEAGDYVYTGTIITAENETIQLFVDTHTEHRGTLQLVASASNSFVASETVTDFALNTGVYYSGAINNVDQLRQHLKLHTWMWYPNGFTGEITVQGTLQNSGTTPGITDWYDIDSVVLADDSTPGYANFTGKYSQIRFKYTTTAGSLAKITYRS